MQQMHNGLCFTRLASIHILLDASLDKSSVIIREPRNQQPFPIMPSEIELHEWFCYNICAEAQQQRVRSIPSISAGKCILCEKDVMIVAVPSTSQCSICLRFTASAPILTASRFCSCRCSCHNDSAAAADEMFVDDPEPISEPVILAVGDTEDGVREYRAEAGSNLLEISSRRSSTSSMWSNCASEFAIDRPELVQLHYGLNFWDIHDLTISNTGERLERQFPEINEVHAINLTEQEGPLIPAPVTCRICKRHYHMNVASALREGTVRECEDCSCPILRASERTMEGLVTREQIETCRCICRCNDLETEQVSVPCYFPFAGEPRVNPAPWVREILQDRGFCLRDRCGNGLPCSVDSDKTIPCLQRIVAGTYREYAHNHRREVAEEYAAYRAHVTFPNGIPKSRETDSGLPVVLENYFRSVDPEAFGQSQSRDSSRRDGASRRISAVSSNGYLAQDQFPPRHSMIRLRSDLSDSDTRRIEELHAWLLWNDWRIEDDDDNQSVCTADGLGVSRDEWEGRMGDAERSRELPRALEAHNQRHLFRRYQRIARHGGFPATSADIWEVVDAEIEFEESESAREAESPVWTSPPSTTPDPSEAELAAESQAQSHSPTQSPPTTQHQTQQAPSTQDTAVSLLTELIGGLERTPEDRDAGGPQLLRDLLARGRDAVSRAFDEAVNRQFGIRLQDALARGLTVDSNMGRFAVVNMPGDNVGMGGTDHVAQSTPES